MGIAIRPFDLSIRRGEPCVRPAGDKPLCPLTLSVLFVSCKKRAVRLSVLRLPGGLV